jgi:hypothetical protein
MTRLKKYLFFSQASLLVCLLICSAIVPSVVVSEGGVSNFGDHISTVGIYTLGFILNITFIYLAAELLIKQSHKLLRIARALMLLCCLTFLVFLSTFPRHYSFTFSYIHDYLGIVLFAYEFLISIYLVKKQRTYRAFSWITIQAVGSIVGLLSIIKVIHWLYVGQSIGCLGFGLVLVLLLPEVIKKQSSCRQL